MSYVEELRALRRSPDIVVASLAANTLGLVLPLVMIQLYDRVIPNAGYETLIVLGLGLAVAVLCDATLRVARGLILSRAGARFELMAYSTALDNLLRSPDRRAETAPGVLLNELSQIDRIRAFHTGDTGTALLDLPFVFVFLGVMIAISPVLGGTVLTLVALVFLLVRMVRHRITHLSNTRLERDGRRQSFLIETLGGIEVIKALGAEDFMERRYERLMTGSASVSARLATHVQGAQGVAGAAGLLAPVVTAGVGAMLVIDQQLTVGALAASVLLTGRIVQPALRVEMLLAGEDDVRGYEETITALLSADAPVARPLGLPGVDQMVICGLRQGAVPAPQSHRDPGQIKLVTGDCLAVRGRDSQAVTAALTALSGHGAEGAIQVQLGQAPLEYYTHADLRQRISLVSGDHRPLTGTILENLTRFQPEQYRERALELCAKLGIDRFIARHPSGLAHPLVGDVAGELPTVIADGIAIISALVTDPDVIVFDEVGTSFDPKILEALAAYLAEVKGQRILILASDHPDFQALSSMQAHLADGVLELIPDRPVLQLSKAARRVR